MAKAKNLAYYDNLAYKLQIIKISEEDGGGYEASLPELGSDAFVACGDSIDDAINHLETIKTALIAEMLESGLQIPEPIDEISYSGRFVLRIPPYLHKRYAEHAKQNNLSLNTAITIALEKHLEAKSIVSEIESKMHDCLEPFRIKADSLIALNYQLVARTEKEYPSWIADEGLAEAL